MTSPDSAKAGLPAPLTADQLRLGAEQLAALDPDFDALLQRFGPPPLWPREPGFATLVQIILEQQVALKAARTLFERLDRHLGGVRPAAVLEVGEAGLRDQGLTRQKARYCHELARRVDSGALNLEQLARQPDADGRQALLAVPGLGPWSVDVYYLMALRRPDVWPQGDLALAVALQDIKGLASPPTRAEQHRFASAWSPWRAVAARLLWVHYLAARGDYPEPGQ